MLVAIQYHGRAVHRYSLWLPIVLVVSCSRSPATTVPAEVVTAEDTPRVPESLSSPEAQELEPARPPRPEPAEDYEWARCRPMPEDVPIRVSLPDPLQLEDLLRFYVTVTCDVLVIPKAALARTSANPLGKETLTIEELRRRLPHLLVSFGMTLVAPDDRLLVVPDTPKGPGPEPTGDERVVYDVRGSWQKTPDARARERAQQEASKAHTPDPLVDIVRCSADRCQVDAAALAARGGRPARVRLVKRKAGGYKLYGIRPGTLLHAIGIANSDTLVGFSESPLERAAEPTDTPSVTRFERAFDEAIARGGSLQLELESPKGARRTLELDFMRAP